MGFKLAETRGLREACDSKELWKSVEKPEAQLPVLKTGAEKLGRENGKEKIENGEECGAMAAWA
jgi:hypothetical protein